MTEETRNNYGSHDYQYANHQCNILGETQPCTPDNVISAFFVHNMTGMFKLIHNHFVALIHRKSKNQYYATIRLIQDLDTVVLAFPLNLKGKHICDATIVFHEHLNIDNE